MEIVDECWELVGNCGDLWAGMGDTRFLTGRYDIDKSCA